ncbi:MAG: amino acid adenylation domain-containing protein [Gemmatimonadota bacterium]
MSTQASQQESSAERRRLLAEVLRGRQGEPRVFPLSFSQQRLWFLDRMDPGSAAYNLSRVVRMEGELRADVLERALGEIVRRHASLRTVFTTAAGDPAQLVSPPGDFRLPTVPVAGATRGEREAAALRLAEAESRRPFDLERGPLFRATLLRVDERDHLLVLVMHHVVTDGWSTGVFFRELGELYAAFLEGRPSPLPEPSLQYADFAVWQRRHLAGEALDRQAAFWRERLAGAPPLLELPLDHPRPPVQSRAGAVHEVVLEESLASGLRELARREGATPFMALLAAFQLLLARWSGRDDVVVGTPVAGRGRPELEPLIGFFVNTLPIRAELSGDPTFRQLLAATRETVLEAQAHADVPFERLVEELRVERSLAYSPVFQVMFALHAAAPAGLSLPGLTLRPVRVAPDAAKFDLSVEAFDARGGIRVALEYATALFDAATVERLGGHLRVLLEAAVRAPDARARELPLLGAAERERVVAEWNDTARPYPDALVHELFAEQAARTPDAPAVLTGGEPLTYAGLDRRSDLLARALRERGAGPDARVGLCLERGPELPAAVLGTLKAGAAYVPLDPAYPPERLRYVLADAGISLVVAEAATAAILPDFGGEVVLVDGTAAGEALSRSRTFALSHSPSPDSLAYVIYTSGSTGQPKGVEVSHRGFASLLRGARDGFGFGPGDVVPVLASYSFDIWGFEALVPLVSGGAIRIVPRDEVVDVPRLADGLRGATAVHAVPALMRQVAEAVAASPAGPVTGVRRVFVGGEAVPPDLLPEIRAAFPEAETRVLYGPTEATVLAASHRVRAGETVAGSLLGRPLPNARTYVLDPAGAPAPVGTPGELYLGGAGVARGYLGRPDATAERFVPDPFGGEPGARLYRTGDRARWRPDGVLEFLGRTDAQVKIRGFRIEPGEVEAAMAGAPGVRGAVVVAREDAPGERRLVGYVAGETTPAAVREHLRERLPEHVVPAAVVVLDALPVTSRGKIDRKALPEPGLPSGAEHVAPRTPVEEVLAAAWAEVLGTERVGARDDFFALGGHSLLATRVQSRIRAALGVELPLRALFEAPTLDALARRVEAARRADEGIRLPPLLPAARRGDAPLSFAQERLWVIDRLDPGSAVYNMPSAFRLAGALRVDALRAALDALAERHESLRTVFPEAEGGPVQRVLPAAPVPLPLLDLSGLPEDRRPARARALAAEEARRGFDLAAGPLFRAALLRLDAGEHVLLLSLHHVVGDGWSMGVVLGELSALYAASAEGRASPLPAPALQYADFAAWQRGWLAGGALERQLAFWRGRLAGAPPALELPADRPRPASWSTDGALHPFAVSAEVRAALAALARREGATLFMALLAAWQLLLARYADQDDVVVGTPIAGRTHRSTEELVGFFVNTLALRADLSGDPGFRELVRRAKRGTLDAYAHQDLPFEKLVEELHPERALDRNPVFQVLFALQNAPAAELELPGVAASPLPTGSFAAKFDLSLGMHERADGIAAGLGYARALFDAATVERMARHFGVLLEGIAAAPDARLSALPLLDAAERRAVLAAAAGPEAQVPAGLRAHDLFAEAARLHPDAPAVLSGAETVTYAELDARSNRIARRLRALGVGPEVPVAICTDAPADAVAAALGVMKAGGCYVPVDPSYPAGRIRLVLEDAAAPVVLTHSAVAAGLPEHAGQVVRVDDPAAGIAEESAEPVDGGAMPEGAAYVIYTSGSTGRPKGVRVEHRGLAALLVSWRGELGMGPGDVSASLASFAFDVWVLEVLVPLAAGAAVRLVPRDRAMETERLAAELDDVTLVYGVPALMRQVVAAARGGGAARVRSAFVGGDAVPAELLREMRAAFPAADVRVGYGPTEATVMCSAHGLADGLPRGRHTLGRPLPGARLYVVDRAGGPVPDGVPGELWIGGAGTARGYHGRPELTAERWVPDSLGGGAGARLYRSGDRVRRLADGSLEFLGRVDFQVKIRGFRIEPGEVEVALLAHPGVADAVVVAREDAPGGRRLVGYVAPAGADAADPAALRAWLRERLPEHMVPSVLVALDALPLAPNGKTDRRALPAPEAPGADAEAAAPRTPTEEVLAGIFADVLGVPRVGVDRGFFDLGGHSLLATRVVSRIRAALGVEVPLRAVFEHPTVAALAEAVAASRQASAPPVLPRDRSVPAPLSFSQRRLWFLDRMEPVNAHFNVAGGLRLSGPLDPAVLERCFAEVVRRHEALRTVFRETAGEPVQVVAPAGDFPLPVEDLSPLPPDEREAAARRIAGEEARRPVDLEAGPLVRVRLLRLAPEEHVLVLMLHHAVSDAWSFGVLYRELAALYRAFARGEPSPLPEPELQYADFSAWQRERLAGEELERQIAFWRGRLEGAPALLELPTDRPRPAVQTHRAGIHLLAIPREAADALRETARRAGATPFMALLAGYAATLRRYAGQDDLVVGTPIAGRTRAETEGMIGFFLNMLALRVDLSGDPSFAELLGRVRETTLGAYAHQEIPFEKLLEELKVERSLGHAAVYQVSINLPDAGGLTLDLPGIRVSPIDAGGQSAALDLALTAGPARDGGLYLSATYNADLFDAATVEAMTAHMARVLAAGAADPSLRLSALVPVLDEERALQVERWNETARPFASGHPVHHLVRAAALRTPDAPAVVQEGAATLTHAELDRRADALAARLAALGVGPEVRVALCLERSPEMLVALLAVLKAGGCYVPVDPAYPADRIRYVLEDSGARVLLTQERLVGALPEFGGEIVVCDGTPLPPAPSPARGEGENDGAEAAFAASDRALTPRPPLPMLGEGEHGGVSVAHSAEGREALPQNWGRVASLSEPGGGAPEDASSVSAVEEAVLPSPLAGERPGEGGLADSAAYVIYTSGSTGRPKGVVVPHRALASYAAAAVELYGITPADRVLQFASLSFDASAEEIYPALLGGASLVLRTEEMLRDAATFFRRCAEWGVTVLDLPTAYWHELVAELERGAVRLPDAVRLVIIGGERALPERVAAWRRHVGDGVRLVNTYGPTEATVVATLAELQGREEAPPLADQPLPPVPIGKPVPNGRVYVLDGDMRPLPVGARGELYVGGLGVARGYLGRPELTAEKFVPDPFSADAGARLYRTGDVARWRRTGELEFVGRADDQVKVRGFRIEPGEIEGVLLRHPSVRDAVVAAREDEPGRARLVGYVVPIGQAPSVAELRAHLKAELPEYMVPAAFVFLDALPRTASGKTDRRALPAPGAPTASAEAYVAPRTEAERRLAEIWAEVLRVERVGAHDDFFALGGHSLLATQVVSRARQAFGAELPLRAVFERPTVAGLAALLPATAALAGEAIPAAEAIEVAGSALEDQLLEGLDELSEADVERLLADLSPD